MTANLKDSKSHIHYMKRRLRVGETPASPKVATASLGLKLGGTANPSNDDSKTVKEKLTTVPLLVKDYTLDKKHPVVRFNKRASAIGSLALMNVEHVGWELHDGSTGYLYANDEIEVNASYENYETGNLMPPLPEVRPQAFSNRPVIEFHKGALLVGLRHFKNIKRLIVVPIPGENIYGGTSTSPTVSLYYEQDSVIYLSVVDSVLEFRRETYRGSIHETFGIGTYQPVKIDHADKSGTGANDLRALFGNN